MLTDFSDDTIELERFRIDQAIRHEGVEKVIQIIAAKGMRTSGASNGDNRITLFGCLRMFFVSMGTPLARRALRSNHALALSGISRSSPTQGGPSDCLRPP